MSTINEKFETTTVLGHVDIGGNADIAGTLALTGGTSGILKAGVGGAVGAASAGSDYLTPTGSAAGLTGLTSGQVTGALGYTPLAPNGSASGLTGLTSGQVTGALGYTPLAPNGDGSGLTGFTSSQITGALGYTPQSAASSFNLGTTSVALNRASAPMTLTGITSIDGSAASASSASNLAGGSTGAIAYQSGTGATSFLTAGTSSQVLIGGASSPSYASTLPVAALPAFTTDATSTAGSAALTVKGINGVQLSGLATGLLKNTTATGVPTIASAGTDYAAPSQSFYIGTTSVTINRSSAPLTLAGITLTTPNIGNATATQLGIGTLTYTPTANTTKIWYADTQNNFINAVIQNKSTGTTASSDLVCVTNQGNDTSQYIDMGVNCSGWTGTSYGAAKDGYLYVEGGASGVGNLLIGTAQASTKIKFQAGTLLNASSGILELTNTQATVGGYLSRKSSATVTAGTNAQGQGVLTSDINIVTTTSGNPSGVTLPTAASGLVLRVINFGTNPINVYPASGGTIDALATNASLQIPVNGWLEFIGTSATAWRSSISATMERKWHGQVASTSGTTTISPGTSAPLVSAGTQIMSQAVTPNSATANYSISAQFTVSTNNYDGCITVALFRDNTFLGAVIEQAASIAAIISSNRQTQSVALRFTDSPNTTSAVTYSIRIGIDSGTWYVNRRSGENTYGGTQGGWIIEEHYV